MKIKIYLLQAAALAGVILLMSCPTMAVEVTMQPRLETGAMYYAFESEAMNVIDVAQPVRGQLGGDFTQKAFEYGGYLPFIGAGATLFVNRFFMDLSGQYASGGKDTTPISYSAFSSNSDAELFVDGSHRARFDRSDAAVSLGYAFTRRFNLFAGYKWAATQFKTTFQGRYTLIDYNFEDETVYATGRTWGEADYKFEYQGPFVGAIHAWDCSHRHILKGMLTVNLALAHLEGEVKLKRRNQYWALNTINGQPVPEVPGQTDAVIAARHDTNGDAWGLTFGVGWRGATAVKGLSYSLRIGGYRYEFDAEDNHQSDINETALIYKIGLAYVF